MHTKHTAIGTRQHTQHTIQTQPYTYQTAPKQLQYAIGSPLHQCIQNHWADILNTPNTIHNKQNLTPPIHTYKEIRQAIKTTITTTLQDITIMYALVEWRWHQSDMSPLQSNPGTWTIYSPFDSDSAHHPNTQLPEPHQIIKKHITSTRRNPHSTNTHTNTPYSTQKPIKTTDTQIYQLLNPLNSPLIIATDVSHQKHPTQPNTYQAAAAIVIIAKQNLKCQQNKGRWQNKNTIPILTRIHGLPQSFGTTKTCINTAELQAIAMAHELIPS